MLDSSSLYNKRVFIKGSNKCVGRIRNYIIYDNNCIGYIIKRPDFLLMFHRKEGFLPLENSIQDDNQVSVESKKSIILNIKNYLNKKNINWNKVFSILEMTVKIGNKKIGNISRFSFDNKSGNIDHIELSKGALSGTILGKNKILMKDIKGYSSKSHALMLKNNAEILEAKKGIAEKSGKATSYVIHKVKTTSPKVIDSMQEQSDKIHKMFKDFKEELNKGMDE